MTMTNMDGPERSVSVIEPLTPAARMVKAILFSPFDIKRWFVIGFGAWLASFGQTGGSGSWSPNFNFTRGIQNWDFEEMFQKGKQWVQDNLDWLIQLSVLVAAILIAGWVLILWLSSRGRFMFLHCIARNVSEVVNPWKKYAEEAKSLFIFRLCLTIIASFIYLIILTVLGFGVIPPLIQEGFTTERTLGLATLVLTMVAVGIIFGIIGKLTHDFVVPIMYKGTPGCVAAWGQFREMASGHLGTLILYLLFQIVIKMAIGTGLVIIALATCCIGGIIMAIPYLGTVVLLPVLVFERGYSLNYLAQFGPDYNVFLEPTTEDTPPPSQT